MISKSLEILIPCHNEKGNIELIVEKCLNWLKKYTKDYRVLIVDDGSIDGTQEVLLNLIKKYPNSIKVITHKTNLGIGMAFKTLYENASGDFIFTCPGDGQFNPEEFTQAIPYLNKVDLISFYRTGKVNYNSFRNILSLGNRLCNRIFFGLKIRDVNWVKMIKQNLLKELDLKSHTSLIETEILTKAKKLNKDIIELPSTNYKRIYGKSEGSGKRNTWMVLKDLFNVYRIVREFK